MSIRNIQATLDGLLDHYQANQPHMKDTPVKVCRLIFISADGVIVRRGSQPSVGLNEQEVPAHIVLICDRTPKTLAKFCRKEGNKFFYRGFEISPLRTGTRNER